MFTLDAATVALTLLLAWLLVIQWRRVLTFLAVTSVALFLVGVLQIALRLQQ